MPRAVPRPARHDDRVRPQRARPAPAPTPPSSTRASPHPVIDLMDAQRDVVDMGGTMRLGAYYAVLAPGTKVHEAYGEPVVSERHRHRYEFNNAYRTRFETAGFLLAGLSPDRRLVEFMELADHPFYVGTQAHPEFKSRPDRPHPLFRELIAAALARAEGRNPHIPFERAAEPTAGSGASRAGGVTTGRLPAPRRARGPSGPHLARRGRHVRGPRRHARSSATSCARPAPSASCRSCSTRRATPSVVLVRQYRPALDAELIEIPAGMRDVDGEPPEMTARRELAEEVGLGRRAPRAADGVPQLGGHDRRHDPRLPRHRPHAGAVRRPTVPRRRRWRCSRCRWPTPSPTSTAGTHHRRQDRDRAAPDRAAAGRRGD